MRERERERERERAIQSVLLAMLQPPALQKPTSATPVGLNSKIKVVSDLALVIDPDARVF